MMTENMEPNKTEGRHPTILLVDDSPANLGVLVGYLEVHGYDMLVAEDGEEALQRVELARPDLILLDVMMPGLDGFEVCRRLKAQPHTAAIPVIFMTSLGGIEDKVKGFEAGAVDYITKPLHHDEVMVRVGTHLKLHALQQTLQAEIAERKRVEDELRLREREFRSLAENVPDNVARWDAEGRILYSNPTHQKTLGKAVGEILGKTHGELFSDERYAEFDAVMVRVVAEGKGELIERVPELRDDGETHYHDVKLSPEFDEAGRVVSVLGLGRDMTDIYRLQEAIAASERQFRSLADSSPGMMGAFYLRPDGSICMPYVSPNIRELFGLHPHEVKDDASPLMARTHPDDAQRVGESIAGSARNMTTWHEQYRILHPARGERWMESLANPEPHPDGGVVWYGYVHDITERKRMEEDIKLKEFALEKAQTAVYLLKVEGLAFIYVNEAACRSLGYSRDELLSLALPDIDPFLTPEEGMAIMEQIAREGRASIESRHRRRDGSSFPVEVQITPLEYRGQSLHLTLVRDITERKHAEAALKESEARYRHSSNLLQSIFESSSSVGIYALDSEYRYLAFNSLVREGAKRLWGADIAVGMSMLDEAIDNDAHRAFCKQGFDYVLAGNNFSLESKETKIKDGETVYEYHDNHSSPIRNENGEVIGLTLFTSNITERKRIEHELEESRIQLRGLIARLEDAREEERKTIAREVHDNLGQILSGLHLSIFRLESRYAANSEEMRKFIQDAMELTDQAIGEVRNISTALRPAELDMGIHAALAWKAARFAVYTGIACEVYDEAADIKLDEHYSITLFRIAQESLTNVARHSGADSVDITLKKEADDYVLTVRDNGTGFDAGVKKERSFGLVGMRERAAMLGGSIAINSGAGKGTEVVVRLPARE